MAVIAGRPTAPVATTDSNLQLAIIDLLCQLLLETQRTNLILNAAFDTNLGEEITLNDFTEEVIK